jgi:hypothetical protein
VSDLENKALELLALQIQTCRDVHEAWKEASRDSEFVDPPPACLPKLFKDAIECIVKVKRANITGSSDTLENATIEEQLVEVTRLRDQLAAQLVSEKRQQGDEGLSDN